MVKRTQVNAQRNVEMHVVVSWVVLHVGKIFYLYEFTELNFCLLPPVGLQTIAYLID